MSTNVSDLIAQALREIPDKSGRRTDRDEMLSYYNRVQERLAIELRCLQADYYFDLVGGEPRYTYPDDMVQMAMLRIARIDNPTQLSDYYWLTEKTGEEYRRATWAFRPAAWVYAYHARPAWFELLNAPVADRINGGIITVWHLPQQITSDTPYSVMELRDLLRGTTIDGMKILARMAGREQEQASRDWQRWLADLDKFREKFEDPSDDRRDSLRPPGADNWTGNMR